MSRQIHRIRVPKYCRHAGRNKGYVRLDEQVIYLPGAYGSPESKAEYDRLVAAWLAYGRQLLQSRGASPFAMMIQPVVGGVDAAAETPSPKRLTVGELVAAYSTYAENRYAKHGHFYAISTALNAMVDLFGDTPVEDFGPKRFKAVRQALVEKKLKRREINRRMQFIRNAIRWAVSEELIPGEVLHRLAAVEILRRGEAPVPESEKVYPVEEWIVLETIKHVTSEVAAMVRLQMLTGARSGEMCLMREIDIDRKKDVWLYRPHQHKTQSRGKERVIPLGPRAQEILTPFLGRDPRDYIFSPAVAVDRYRKEVHEKRVTPPNAGNNIGTNVRLNPERVPGDHYTADSYGRAILRAAQRAFPLPEHLARRVVTPTGRKKKPRPETEEEWWTRLTPEQRVEVEAWWKRHHWHPHQLRHTVGTAVRDRFGVDFSQALLGHSNVDATQIYAAVNTEKAVQVMREIG